MAKGKPRAGRAAFELVLSAMDAIVRDLSPKDYKECLDELFCDIEGRLEALKDEQPGLDW